MSDQEYERMVVKIGVVFWIVAVALIFTGCRAPIIDNSRSINVHFYGTGAVWNAEALIEKTVGKESDVSPNIKGVSLK